MNGNIKIVETYSTKAVNIYILGICEGYSDVPKSYYTTWCGNNEDIKEVFNRNVFGLMPKNKFRGNVSGWINNNYRPSLNERQSKKKFIEMINALDFVTFETIEP